MSVNQYQFTGIISPRKWHYSFDRDINDVHIHVTVDHTITLKYQIHKECYSTLTYGLGISKLFYAIRCCSRISI